MTLRLALFLAVFTGLVVATAPAATRPATVEIAFLRDGRLVRVERIVPRGSTPEVVALRELVRGPTRAERAQGIRTVLPPDTRLRTVEAEGDVWLVSFSRSLLAPATASTMRKRLFEIEATLRRLGPERFAAISTHGRLATVLRLGVRPGSWRPVRGENDFLYDVRGIQLRLWTLGFLDRSDVTGTLDYASSQALLAFQGWEGLARTGTVTGQTQVALFHASRPVPSARADGRRIEIHRAQGVLLMVDRGVVVRAVHTSTGPATPAGTFHVFRKDTLSWSVPFQVWMPYASYFVGGIAMHEYPDVPSYPASHGCVRLPAGDAQRVYRFVDVGTRVDVF